MVPTVCERTFDLSNSPTLSVAFSVHPQRPLCLCVECFYWYAYHRDTEFTEIAQSRKLIPTGLQTLSSQIFRHSQAGAFVNALKLDFVHQRLDELQSPAPALLGSVATLVLQNLLLPFNFPNLPNI